MVDSYTHIYYLFIQSFSYPNTISYVDINCFNSRSNIIRGMVLIWFLSSLFSLVLLMSSNIIKNVTMESFIISIEVIICYYLYDMISIIYMICLLADALCDYLLYLPHLCLLCSCNTYQEYFKVTSSTFSKKFIGMFS